MGSGGNSKEVLTHNACLQLYICLFMYLFPSPPFPPSLPPSLRLLSGDLPHGIPGQHYGPAQSTHGRHSGKTLDRTRRSSTAETAREDRSDPNSFPPPLSQSNDVSEDGATVCIKADAPLAQMFGYSTDLRSITQGKGP